LRGEEGPEGGAVHHDAVVEVHAEGGVGEAGGAGGVGGGGAALGAAGDGFDEVGELVAEALPGGVLLVGGGGGLPVGGGAGLGEVGELAVELAEEGVEVISKEGLEGGVRPAVDIDPGDEAALVAAEGEMDGAVVVGPCGRERGSLRSQSRRVTFLPGKRVSVIFPGGEEGAAAG
jgi:hypothetical protein